MTRLPLSIAALAICLSFAVREAQAIPILQLFLEGGTYDTVTESWSISPSAVAPGEPYRLWAIGNIEGPAAKGTISNVRLSAAYNGSDLGLSITLTPSQAGGLDSAGPGVGQFNGIIDPSVPIAPLLNTTVQTSLGEVTTGPDGVVSNGSTALLGNRKALPAHGIFGGDTVWKEFALGDFDLPDSEVGDFIGSFPTELRHGGQINVYELWVSGAAGAKVHFDLYGLVGAKNRPVFAPFSHDADDDTHQTPEPASVVVWSLLGLVGAAAGGWRRRRRR